MAAPWMLDLADADSTVATSSSSITVATVTTSIFLLVAISIRR
jgi:hypothetical protein